MPKYRLKHREILTKVDYWIKKGYSITKIKKWTNELLYALYFDVKKEVKKLIVEQKAIIEDVDEEDIKSRFATFQGLNLEELFKGRIGTHLRSIIAQNKTISKLKSSNIGALSGLVDTITKTQREQSYNKVGDKLPNIKGWLSIAVLDGRTSPICMSLHNKFYQIKKRSDVPNLPPRHPNCRSLVVPVYYGDNVDDLRGIKLSTWLRDNPTKGRKLLGDEKYQLVVDNEIEVNSFVDIRNGRYYTNEEIKDNLSI